MRPWFSFEAATGATSMEQWLLCQTSNIYAHVNKATTYTYTSQNNAFLQGNNA